ncbi:Asp-tRNA(Asn)/Glu-tRNA(Gln) amidotransferase subunit GatA [Kamptonema cortianum]|nr:Asp-tRNA(Asn)/Glu-tRNA(Gln) amidotransferase subunit GatA [Kamptonema cortianum]MDL5049730.1 Asp-tRNA(Asn)/Glu-tRNA(Gln) amidotransferase subunit GatA [Oscillatoria amoena NRMC-F 0135]
MSSLASLPIHELHKQLSSAQIAPVDIAESLISRVESVEPKVGALLNFDADKLRDDAKKAVFDASQPLSGIPVTLKDNINALGATCSCASKILEPYRSPYDATVTRKLRGAGALLFGRANLDEFAMGSSTENSALKKTRNPWDLERIPGGSSGGSAAAVAADEAICSLGSDTGGSIRQPASLCGVTGLKPTYGRVSRYGLVAFASSLDQIGPVTKDVRDAAILLNVISGQCGMDSTSLDAPAEDFTAELGRDIKGLKLGLPKQYFISGIDPEVESAVRNAVKQYESLGAEIVEVDLPHTEYAVATYYIIATAEASSNLARFDGVRYGLRAQNTDGIIDMYGKTREEGFGPEVKRRIILGTYVLSSGYYDAYYLRAQKVRTLIRKDFESAFSQCDAILTPTSPTAAFKAGEKTGDPLQMYLADIFTIAVNLAGNCGISIPCGFTASGLPIGLQIIADSMQESKLLRVAHAYEQATSWHLQKPAL